MRYEKINAIWIHNRMKNYNTLVNKVNSILDDNQASQIRVIDVHEQTTVTDFMIICTGRSSRHVKAVAHHLMEQMKLAGYHALASNGLETGDWALVDYGDCVVHIMTQETREYYDLEGLWDPIAFPNRDA